MCFCINMYTNWSALYHDKLATSEYPVKFKIFLPQGIVGGCIELNGQLRFNGPKAIKAKYTDVCFSWISCNLK